jgi:trans-aconitate methyltransferase
VVPGVLTRGRCQAAVSFLRELAAAGPALELGIGTGRVAVPLHREGVEVHGIDAAEAMLARLRTKEGAASIATSVADFRDFELVPIFKLAYVVFNALFALLPRTIRTCVSRLWRGI